jgi:hypothetical protein
MKYNLIFVEMFEVWESFEVFSLPHLIAQT